MALSMLPFKCATAADKTVSIRCHAHALPRFLLVTVLLTRQLKRSLVVIEHELGAEHPESLIVLQQDDVRPLALGPLREEVLHGDKHARRRDHGDVGARRGAIQQLLS